MNQAIENMKILRDFTEDDSEDFTDKSIDEPGQYGSDDTEAAG